MKRLSFGAVIAALAICAVIITGLMVSSVDGLAQGHDMSNMPGMKRPKAKARTKRKTPIKKRRKPIRRTRPATKHEMKNMPGMAMPKASPSASPQNMPRMPMPQASPSASPQTHMNMPAWQGRLLHQIHSPPLSKRWTGTCPCRPHHRARRPKWT
jgi:hypothetical protein